ncbi:DUF5064 family protein [Stutzerimonas decontaminans]|uniref:DUF5064 family protein n=1 Tax=Stutzerimonas decontaminans TaxID=3022791 RepID=UPI000B17BE69|nr:DUF5064 family protein [Stutzerimonas decontaminans]
MQRNAACNFLQKIDQCLRRHGAPVRSDVAFGYHRLYDPPFEDPALTVALPAVDLERFLEG